MQIGQDQNIKYQEQGSLQENSNHFPGLYSDCILSYVFPVTAMSNRKSYSIVFWTYIWEQLFVVKKSNETQ